MARQRETPIDKYAPEPGPKKGMRAGKHVPDKMQHGLGPEDATGYGEKSAGRTLPRKSPPADRPQGLLAAAQTSRRLRLLTRILTAIAIGLVLLILAGTLYALFREPGANTAPGSSVPGNSPAGNAETAMFTGIGRLRIAAAGGPATVILSIVFPYPATDRPFTEELAGKLPVFRRIAQDYFSALSPEDLVPLDEDKAKTEILGRFNQELQLGQIELLFFNDLLVLE